MCVWILITKDFTKPAPISVSPHSSALSLIFPRNVLAGHKEAGRQAVWGAVSCFRTEVIVQVLCPFVLDLRCNRNFAGLFLGEHSDSDSNVILEGFGFHQSATACILKYLWPTVLFLERFTYFHLVKIHLDMSKLAY